MEEKVRHIINDEFGEAIDSLQEIVGFGLVNKIYAFRLKGKEFIVRVNHEAEKRIEYLKEKWCLEKASALKILSPKVVKIIGKDDLILMIQEKVEGKNGILCSSSEKLKIWYELGRYVKKFHEVNRIEVAEFEQKEFNKNWESRLRYNLQELTSEDSLLKIKLFHVEEHTNIKQLLVKLNGRKLKEGLVHGDLCPRNTIWTEAGVCLLDWGTAEINVVPQNEIGLILMSKEADEQEFTKFLEGLEISSQRYEEMKEEILILNLLHRLDKYRWAEAYNKENLLEYGKRLKEVYEELK